MKRKVALLDVDDVIIRFIEGFNAYLMTKRPDVKIPAAAYLPKQWNYAEFGDISKEMTEFIDKYSDECKVFKGAADFTKKFKDMGFEVVFLTAHPAHKTLERIINLKEQNITFDSLYCTAYYNSSGEKLYRSKVEFAEALGMGKEGTEFLFVDDKAATVVDMLAKFPNCKVFTMDRTYNRADLDGLNLFDEDSSRFHCTEYDPSQKIEVQVVKMYENVLNVAGEM